MVWTVDDIPDQSSRVILITGATSGIGLESARQFARHGAYLVLACRNPQKMANVASECCSLGAKHVEQLVCDTSDLDSVRACAESYTGPQIDVLLLNAGTANNGTSFNTTKQGYEQVFATNQLGHFLLTGILLPRVRERIIAVSSLMHTMTHTIEWEAVRGERPPKSQMYAQSKLANMVFVEELNRRLLQARSNVIAVGAHPGISHSELAEKIQDPGIMIRVMNYLVSFTAQSGAAGAWPLLMAATDKHINRDCYYAPSNRGLIFHESSGPPISNGKKNLTVSDKELGRQLWEQCEKLCGFKYTF